MKGWSYFKHWKMNIFSLSYVSYAFRWIYQLVHMHVNQFVTCWNWVIEKCMCMVQFLLFIYRSQEYRSQEVAIFFLLPKGSNRDGISPKGRYSWYWCKWTNLMVSEYMDRCQKHWEARFTNWQIGGAYNGTQRAGMQRGRDERKEDQAQEGDNFGGSSVHQILSLCAHVHITTLLDITVQIMSLMKVKVNSLGQWGLPCGKGTNIPFHAKASRRQNSSAECCGHHIRLAALTCRELGRTWL